MSGAETTYAADFPLMTAKSRSTVFEETPSLLAIASTEEVVLRKSEIVFLRYAISSCFGEVVFVSLFVLAGRDADSGC